MPIFGKDGNDSAAKSNAPAKPKVVNAGDKQTMKDIPVVSNLVETRDNPAFKQEHFNRVKAEKDAESARDKQRMCDKNGRCFPKNGEM